MYNQFRNIIKEICYEKDIKYKTISKDWIVVLEKNGITRYISGYKFDLNKHALGTLLDDKYATYELLKNYNFPVISHDIVYPSSNNNYYAIGSNNVEFLKSLFFKYNKDIVLKINGGTCGINVEHIKNIDELIDKYKSLTSKYNSLSICPFYQIENEYRAIVLNNDIELLYKKVKPEVIGDGRSTVKELLEKFNSSYFKEINKDSTLDKILDENEVFEYDWRYNLSKGAKVSFEINEKDSNNLKLLAVKISKKIGLGFGSIDIIKTIDGKFFIMEINSGVMMENYIKQVSNGYQVAKDIYKKAIDLIFKV